MTGCVDKKDAARLEHTKVCSKSVFGDTVPVRVRSPAPGCAQQKDAARLEHTKVCSKSVFERNTAFRDAEKL